MKTLKLLCLVAFMALSSGPTLAGPNGECTCRHKTGDIPEGQTACIASPKGMVMARCEKFLNNTSWKPLNLPCPSASIVPAGSGLPLSNG